MATIEDTTAAPLARGRTDTNAPAVARGTLTRAFLLTVAGLYLFPFAYVAFVSLLDPADVMAQSPQFWPPNWGNYIAAWQAAPFERFFLNSVIVSITVTVGSGLTSILAAYVFARRRFYGRDVLFGIVVATLMIPGHITLIPNYLTFARFRALDSYWALILPFLASGFSVFFLRQYFRNIPVEIEEAARIDGAGDWKILWDIIVPMSLPAIAAVSLFTFISEWNSFIWPLLATTREEMRTVPIGLAYMYRQEAEGGLVNWPMVMAGSVIVLLPMIVAFMLAERQLIKGITMGSSK